MTATVHTAGRLSTTLQPLRQALVEETCNSDTSLSWTEASKAVDQVFGQLDQMKPSLDAKVAVRRLGEMFQPADSPVEKLVLGGSALLAIPTGFMLAAMDGVQSPRFVTFAAFVAVLAVGVAMGPRHGASLYAASQAFLRKAEGLVGIENTQPQT